MTYKHPCQTSTYMIRLPLGPMIEAIVEAGALIVKVICFDQINHNGTIMKDLFLP
jgi:hypothetical protein